MLSAFARYWGATLRDFIRLLVKDFAYHEVQR